MIKDFNELTDGGTNQLKNTEKKVFERNRRGDKYTEFNQNFIEPESDEDNLDKLDEDNDENDTNDDNDANDDHDDPDDYSNGDGEQANSEDPLNKSNFVFGTELFKVPT